MRAAQQQAAAGQQQAASSAAGYGAQAGEISSRTVPFLERQLAAPEGFTPQQQNQQLVAGEQGAGGALSSIFGAANLQAMRGGNQAGFATALGQAERQRGQILSQNALNIANQNAMLQQQKQQQALQQLGGLYRTDVDAALQAQGLIPRDVQAETEAGRVGWWQNMTSLIDALSGRGGGGGGGGGGFAT